MKAALRITREDDNLQLEILDKTRLHQRNLCYFMEKIDFGEVLLTNEVLQEILLCFPHRGISTMNIFPHRTISFIALRFPVSEVSLHVGSAEWLSHLCVIEE